MLHLEVLPDRLLLSIFMVTNTGDTGPGSLRQAVLDANANPGLDTIAFDIGGGGVQTIQPASPLPAITDPVFLDGTTQPGFDGVPLVVLNGLRAGPNAYGLTITAGRSTVKGLVVDGFTAAGIALATNGADVITGNYIGTDVMGLAAVPNGAGIISASARNRIGGFGPGDRNIISGNTTAGISISSGGNDNRIEGNFVGTNAAGTAPIPNQDGVRVADGSGTRIGGKTPQACNLIAGNRDNGIDILADDTVVEGNWIGSNVAGTAALGNANGILVERGTDTTIGGRKPGAGNLIAGNTSTGIYTYDTAGRILAEGNFIGTDAGGTRPVPNGIGVDLQSGNNTIGGPDFQARNLISGNVQSGVYILGTSFNQVTGNDIGTDITGTQRLGNDDGIYLLNASHNRIDANLLSGNYGRGLFIASNGTLSSHDNVVQGNFIGTGAGGTTALANWGNGITVAGPNNVIGGTVSGAGNVIAFNGNDGVLVNSGTGNAILRNAIFGHERGLGIELANGGNQGQEAPAITAAASDGKTTTIAGTLVSAPDTAFAIELFVNSTCNPSGFGEGEQFFASLTTMTDDAGSAGFTLTVAVALDPGRFITATATDPANDTSGFSACAAIVGDGLSDQPLPVATAMLAAGAGQSSFNEKTVLPVPSTRTLDPVPTRPLMPLDWVSNAGRKEALIPQSGGEPERMAAARQADFLFGGWDWDQWLSGLEMVLARWS